MIRDSRILSASGGVVTKTPDPLAPVNEGGNVGYAYGPIVLQRHGGISTPCSQTGLQRVISAVLARPAVSATERSRPH